ncbi:hypothetical protein TNCV_1003461 [Trichonephila clavipes]|nr:hypothetical protein TNCV_1003461 [Trichonephila clavipes]
MPSVGFEPRPYDTAVSVDNHYTGWASLTFVLVTSPCLHNGKEVDDWMGLDEWNSWFFKSHKSETQTGAKIL